LLFIYQTYKACLKKKTKKTKWQSEGKQVIMYLGDGLGIEQDDELCKHRCPHDDKLS
jgi:hypothetical protein